MNEPYWIQLAAATASLLLISLSIYVWCLLTVGVDQYLYNRRKRKRMEGSK